MCATFPIPCWGREVLSAGAGGPKCLAIWLGLVVALVAATASGADDAEALAQQALEQSGIEGGLVVHVGCTDGRLTAALRAGPGFLVHGLAASEAEVAAAREFLREQNVQGPVSVDLYAKEQRSAGRLPYVDGLITLLVVDMPELVLSDTAKEEMLRVLAPEGVLCVRQAGQWKTTVKPRPATIDNWTHYLHDSTNNAVAHDREVGPPRHLQWIGTPYWSRHHDRMASMSALVSTGKRLFYIMDEGARISIEMPADWKLIARDAFNGTILWKRPIERWHSHFWPLKSGPTQLARRLVAEGDTVYVTMGMEAPLSAIDATTGETLRVYSGTKATEEVVLCEQTLIAVVNEEPLQLRTFVPTGFDQKRVAKEFTWNQRPRRILALDAEADKTLWSKTTTIAPLTIAADARHVVYHDGARVVCLDRESGETIWTSEPLERRDPMPFHFGPKVVLYEDVVLYAGSGRNRTMTALAADTGKVLWSAPHDRSGYQSPEDLLVVDGLVWSAPTTSGGFSGIYTGRDPHTGEVKKQFPPTVETYWFHHRCYIAKATDRFLLPSRTGIEFVDPQSEQWMIHHWVRGGCLYGIMPCNGLVYAPPHNCACYPEAKLYGFCALAGDSPSRRVSWPEGSSGQLQRGPAFDQSIDGQVAAADDWPTYRHDSQRSGATDLAVPAELSKKWQASLGGKLSSPTVAGGRVFVAEVDRHAIRALDAESGQLLWSFVAGGRIDSPPTYSEGRLLFGSADGWVYSLRASDGRLIWRFHAAPEDRCLVAFEQVESVWPVHGSILVEDGVAWFVAGRSMFLDGGLCLYRLDAKSGELLSRNIMDERDPETGESMQDRVQILNMAVGLPDVLSSDGRYVYMRSQPFDLKGKRTELGPNAGDPAAQAWPQRGTTAHLFSPAGFLDDTWFHRSYWVYGRSFAGGHAGYFQAGRFAPSGRILVFDQQRVYGFGRKPEYLRWTTPLEHQLFAADREPPEVPRIVDPRNHKTAMVDVANSRSLNPTGKSLVVSAWVKAEGPGVVIARGGPVQGYALAIQGGRPHFLIRADEQIYGVRGKRNVLDRWVHLTGVLTAEPELKLYVDGKLAAKTDRAKLIPSVPAQQTQIGADLGGDVGGYKSPFGLRGLVDEVRVWHGRLDEKHIAALAAGEEVDPEGAELVLSLSFDDGKARDGSGLGNHGAIQAAESVEGRVGKALRFSNPTKLRQRHYVEYDWHRDIPLLARAMVLADKTLFVAGPPDLVDEEEALAKIAHPETQQQLAAQDAALRGENGGLLAAFLADNGEEIGRFELDSLPRWDGMAAAGGRLYLATESGAVVCLTGKK